MSAGAAKCHGQIDSIDVDVFGNPMREKREDVFIHPCKRWLGVEEAGNLRIQPVKTAQLGIPVRVWQAAKIEDEIGIGRYPMLEAE